MDFGRGACAKICNIFIAGGSLIPGFLANALKLGAFPAKKCCDYRAASRDKKMCRFYVVSTQSVGVNIGG